jgi:hypothetical protein
MTTEMIEKFVETKARKGAAVNIHFKERSTVSGLFVKGMDYAELKSKNFWRIVSNSHITEWQQTNDINLTRVFNGLSFTRLSEQEAG